MCVIGITPINNDVKEEKSMKFLQKLGKALMLPVAVLPIWIPHIGSTAYMWYPYGYRLYAVSRNYAGWRY